MLRKTPVHMVGRIAPKRSTPSVAPMNPFDISTVIQMMQKLSEMHVDVQALITSLEKKHETFDEIKSGPPGMPGMPGSSINHDAVVRDVVKQIRTPEDGKSPAVAALAGALFPLVMKHIESKLPKLKGEPGTPGKNGEHATPEQVMDMVFQAIEKGDRKIKIEHVAGLDGKFAEVRNAAALGSTEIYGKNTWKRGGGDTVEQGSGIVITSTPDGRKKISAVGGSSGFQVPIAGAVNGTNQAFTWTTEPSVIVVDQGRPMQRISSDGTVNWTVAGNVTTLAVAPNFDIFATN